MALLFRCLVFPFTLSIILLITRVTVTVSSVQSNEQQRSLIVECKGPGFMDSFPELKRTLAEVKDKDRALSTAIQQQIKSTSQCLAPVIELLKKENVDYAILPISNSLQLHAPISTSLREKIASFENVLRVRPDHLLPIDRPTMPTPPLKPTIMRPFGNKTWNLGLIDARCRNIKRLGTNVIVGIIDYGVMYNHTELQDNWLGNQYKDYGWFDATVNETESPFPTDPFGSGTNVMGIAVGKNIGVAPNSIWATCTGCRDRTCSLAALETCALYMACPWKWNDTTRTGNCSLGAKVVLLVRGMSIVGGQTLNPDLYLYYNFVQFLNSVGILPVFSMGDTGPDCNSGKLPGAYDISLSVGAVDENGTIADVSARGPLLIGKPLTEDSTATGSCPALTDRKLCTNASNNASICTITKPDIVAPGYNLNTSTNANNISYGMVSSTNLAAAHTAGVLALMVSANPEVKWNYKLAYEVLTKTTDTSRIYQQGGRENSSQNFPSGSHLLCNMILSGICAGFPDNLYGWGILNACNAVKTAKKLKP